MSLDRLGRNLGGGHLAVFRALRKRAAERDQRVYLVGGPVRDALLGIPLKDLDFALEGDATGLAHELAAELDGQPFIHQRFGTATVKVDGARVDIVTARKESYPQPGSLPEVTPGDIFDDLARRDFTINAMALPLGGKQADGKRPDGKQADGKQAAGKQAKVLDPHGGTGDLRRKLVRTLHPGSFTDDPTRLLRAVRYEQRLGFAIEDDTLQWLREAVNPANRGSIETVTGDRWRHELDKILEEDAPGPVLGRALELGLLSAVHPALNGGGLDRLAQWEKARGVRGSPADYLAALVYSVASSNVEPFIRRLNLPRHQAGLVRDTIAIRDDEARLGDPAMRPSELADALDAKDPAAVSAATKLAGTSSLGQNLARYSQQAGEAAATLTGDDLLAMGAPQGPAVGQILRELRAARLDGRAVSTDDERALALEILSRMAGGSPGG